MNGTCVRIWLVMAAVLFLASGRWLAASCAVSEPTYVVYRAAPLNDWCKEYQNANCLYIRANTASGGINCQTGTTLEWDANKCGCPCNVQALKFCSYGSRIQGPSNTVTKYDCFPAGTSCP